MKKIEGQNIKTTIKREIGKDPRTRESIIVNFYVESTNTKVIVYDYRGKLFGMAGVTRASDFNFESLLKIALERSGSKIDVA